LRARLSSGWLRIAVVEVSELVKVYGDVVAVNGVSFMVQEGEVYGLLGPNGAGKTTIIRILMGLTRPTSGSAKVLGLNPEVDPVSVKMLVGYVPEEVQLFETLTPMELFEFVSSIRGIPSGEASERVKTLVRAFDLEPYVNKPIASLSRGNKQKIAVISALLHKPKLLILDEPFNGLDAKSSRVLKEYIKLHLERGGSVLLSTHVMEIAENLCSRIGIIHKGVLVAEGRVEDLRVMVDERRLEDVFLKLTMQDSEVREIVSGLKSL